MPKIMEIIVGKCVLDGANPKSQDTCGTTSKPTNKKGIIAIIDAVFAKDILS